MSLSSLFTLAAATQPNLYAATSTSQQSANAAAAHFGSVFMIVLVVLLICSFFVGMWRIFTKLGEEGWKILIPVYGNWVYLRLGGQKGWWAILALVPVVNIVSNVMMCIAAYHIGKRLQKPGVFVLLYILLSPIWALILGFSKKAVPADQYPQPAFAPAMPGQPIQPAGMPQPIVAPTTVAQPPETPTTPQPPVPPTFQ